MKNFEVITLLIIGLGYSLIYGCQSESRGFALPQGDLEKGKETFFELGCNHCHSAGELEWIGGPEGINKPLGGDVSTKTT